MRDYCIGMISSRWRARGAYPACTPAYLAEVRTQRILGAVVGERNGSVGEENEHVSVLTNDHQRD